jgi:oligoendopeptidase F
MEQNQPQLQQNIGARDVLCTAWKLFHARFGAMLRFFYLHAGLMLLVLVTAGAFVAAAAYEPALLGSQRGGYRADIILIFCGVPAIVLTALYVAYLHPRAVIASYEAYALTLFGVPRGGRAVGKAANGAHARASGAYWAVLLCRIVCVAGAVLIGVGFSTAAEWIPGAHEWRSVVAWTLGMMFFWQTRLPLGLAVCTAVWENAGGFRAVARGFRHYWRARYAASMAGLATLTVTLLLIVGVMGLSARIAGGDTLATVAIAAFLGALLLPVWRLMLCAVDTAVYAAACCDRTDIKRWYYCSTSSRNKTEQRKGHNKMKTREQIDASFKWDLRDIYASEERWEADFASAQELVNAFPKHAGKLHRSADALYAALDEESKLSLLIERVYSYAHLHKDEDNGNVRYQGMTDRAIQLYVSAEAASSFVEPEILSIPQEMLHDWAKQERFERFRFRISDIDRRRAHTLSTEEERLLAMAEEPLSGADNIFTMLSDVDLDYGTIKDENGEEARLTHGSYGMFLVSADRRVRRDAYEGFYKAYRGMKNTITATYATSVKTDVFRARTHKFDGSLEAALFSNGVPVSVYEQLIEAVHEKLPTLRKYLDIRKRVLGVDQLEMYDLYVPIVTDCDIPMPYDDAKSLVKEALRPLGAPYGELLDDAYTKGWIDVYETPGKTSGAFCAGMFGAHPYVLLNFQGKLDDAFTLGHELGHAMHSHFSNTAQPYETSQYRIMVAEVASTVNETLMTYHLLENETDKMKRAYYITQFLESFRTTCFRQTMFAEFELKSHRMAESGEPLTVDSLSDMYRKLNELYYDGAHVDDNIAIEWMRVPHFYNAFYVYQYATGLCSAVKLADDILHHDGLERYLTFLQSGGSDYPIEELKAAGVDLTKKESILASLDVFTAYVDELDELMK